MGDLYENSESYYGKSYIYDIFSKCEDYPNFITKILSNLSDNKKTLDMGCGNGKYANITTNYIGIDISENQLFYAKKNNPCKCFILSDMENCCFGDNTFDFIFSCWAVSVIKNRNKRSKIINEALRMLKNNGIMLLVENDVGGEFEKIRGRFPNTKRTKEYHDWVIYNEFKVFSKIKTWFQFDSKKTAINVFNSIWGNEISSRVNDSKIEHDVIIFMRKK